MSPFRWNWILIVGVLVFAAPKHLAAVDRNSEGWVSDRFRLVNVAGEIWLMRGHRGRATEPVVENVSKYAMLPNGHVAGEAVDGRVFLAAEDEDVEWHPTLSSIGSAATSGPLRLRDASDVAVVDRGGAAIFGTTAVFFLVVGGTISLLLAGLIIAIVGIVCASRAGKLPVAEK